MVPRIATLLGRDTAQRIARVLPRRTRPFLAAPSIDGLLEARRRADIDVVLVERALLGERPAASLGRLLEGPDPPEVLVLAADERPVERAELVSAGCRAVLWLGLDDGPLGAALEAVLRRREDELADRWSAGAKRSTLDEFVARSPAMQRFLHLARRLGRGDSSLLILGETGVGKERLARSLHAESRRAGGPFVPVHCGALPETLLESELFGHEEGAFTGATRARRGYFELADGGTIFLDEIGEMPPHLQVKLLRVLEERRVQRLGGERLVEVDVRIMAATNRDLEKEMAAGRFRPDLYYRLAVVTLTVPPLRERREDIPELAQELVERFARQFGRPVRGLRPEAVRALLHHQWPGNVRELINVIERAVLLATGPEIGLADLRAGEGWIWAEAAVSEPEDPWAPWYDRPFREARSEIVASFERAYLERCLRATGGRIGAAARRAGLNERTLYELCRRHGIRKEDFKPRGAPANEPRPHRARKPRASM